MAQTPQTKEKKEPTIWHVIGGGVTIALLALVTFYSLVEGSQPKSIANFLSLFTTDVLPYMIFIIFVCTIGAYIGKSSRKSFLAIWIGALVGLIVSVVLFMLGFFIFVFN